MCRESDANLRNNHHIQLLGVHTHIAPFQLWSCTSHPLLFHFLQQGRLQRPALTAHWEEHVHKLRIYLDDRVPSKIFPTQRLSSQNEWWNRQISKSFILLSNIVILIILLVTFLFWPHRFLKKLQRGLILVWTSYTPSWVYTIIHAKMACTRVAPCFEVLEHY